MNCEQARQSWHDRTDGRIIDDAALASHVAGCSACRRYCDEMLRLTDLIDQLGRDTEAIVSRRELDLRTRRPLKNRIVTVLRPWIAAAAAVAITATVSIQFFLGRSADLAPPTGGARPAHTTSDVTASPLGLTLQGDSAARFMVVREGTSQENVQVFRLFRTLTPPGARENS